jgi:hypothetical protein
MIGEFRKRTPTYCHPVERRRYHYTELLALRLQVLDALGHKVTYVCAPDAAVEFAAFIRGGRIARKA